MERESTKNVACKFGGIDFCSDEEQDEKKKRKSAFFIAIVLRLYKQIITTN